ncbi:EFh, partial [Musa troglodytarum]
ILTPSLISSSSSSASPLFPFFFFTPVERCYKGEKGNDDDNIELQSIFSTFDKDGDGFITVKELEESLRRLGLAVTGNEVMHMLERVDTNGDCLIDLGEFRELYAALGEEEEEETALQEAFDVFDGNRDGVIAAEELATVLTSLGLKQGARLEDCRDMIRRVDRDGDGKVSFDEFKKMMKMKGGKLF